jgi:hypothetical protein
LIATSISQRIFRQFENAMLAVHAARRHIRDLSEPPCYKRANTRCETVTLFTGELNGE